MLFMKKKFIRVILFVGLLILCVIFFMGCSMGGSTTSGRKIDKSLVSKVEKGRSSKSEISSLMGVPFNTFGNQNTGEDIWVYQYGEINQPPCISMNPLVGSEITRDVLTITFTKDGIVKEIKGESNKTNSDGSSSSTTY